jgi:hypothetical protein
MNDYLIGAGALLTAGPSASLAGASLHAQIDAALAPRVRAALFDFESGGGRDLSQVLALVSGWNGARVRAEIVEPLLARGECSLADVLLLLAAAAKVEEIHLFARWLPGELLVAQLRAAGVDLVTHPLESIRQAALVSGQRFSRWPAPLRAA